MHAETKAGIALGLLLGLAAGVGGYAFVYAKGASYLTDRAEACANCHIMRAQYDAWIKSSHRIAAVCNDCHTPEATIAKYRTKTANGFRHSFAFTTGRFPEPIRIKPYNLEITENRCRGCHQEIIAAIEGPHGKEPRRSCIDCHSSVGHAS